MAALPHFYPVILAGGRGTRFWPRSRARAAKQVLALDPASRRTMIQQTVARLGPLATRRNFWVITNRELRPTILRQLPGLRTDQILAEPVGRNTAPAAGLAAFLLLRDDRNAVMGMFPADHVIADASTFRRTVERAVRVAAAGTNLVVMGVRPMRPETGYGYVETGAGEAKGLLRVRCFTEKPDLQRTLLFLRKGNYLWNSGMFVWRADTLVDALRTHRPQTAAFLERIAAAWGTTKFDSVFRSLYPRCDNISVDYAVMEPQSARGEGKSGIFCIPADFGWNDLGSWAALHQHLAGKSGGRANVVDGKGQFLLDADGNYIHAPGKFVAALGVKDLVVVETDDALLITTRQHSQDVGKVVQRLASTGKRKLL
ncbi:MAG: NTP transferase domain-containing protein [Acidobacteria bacterium]|nr:NTP transferase domain-containing protein [Acidobacteriota bacterium]